jgi:hypothetical protein
MAPRFATRAAIVAALAASAGACASPVGDAPPAWEWFDVTSRPVGAAPATAGWALGHLAWVPAGLVLDTVLPEFVAYAPGDAVGLACGLALGAPFHLVSAPFGRAGSAAPPEPEGETR